jgi:hypothetical protein
VGCPQDRALNLLLLACPPSSRATARPDALLLGLPDNRGRLRVAGRTGPLTLPARRELGALLVPPQRAHPWPERIPSSRLGQLPGEAIDYAQTEPLLVVEVDADVCFEHERWRPLRGSAGSAATCNPRICEPLSAAGTLEQGGLCLLHREQEADQEQRHTESHQDHVNLRDESHL